MKTLLKQIAIATVLLAVLLSGCSKSNTDPSAPASAKQNQQEVTVAIVSSLTGSLAENGKDTANGAKLAFEKTNAAEGVRGVVVRVEMFDDQADPKVAASLANRVVQDKRIVAVVGHLTSGCTLAAAPVYARAGIPVVMPVPTNPQLTAQGYSNVFRIPPTDNEQAPFLAQFMLKRDPQASVAVVNDLTAYGVGFAQAFSNTFAAGGGRIVAYEGVQKESRDYRTIVTKLKAQDPKCVVLAATYDLAAPFLRQMKELGLGATPFSGDGCFSTELIQQAGGAAEGMIVSFIAPDRALSPKTDAFYREFEAKYGKVVSFAPLGYDAALVVLEAMNRSTEISRTGIIAALRRADKPFQGVTGSIAFDAAGDNTFKNLSLYVVKNGKFELLKANQ